MSNIFLYKETINLFLMQVTTLEKKIIYIPQFHICFVFFFLGNFDFFIIYICCEKFVPLLLSFVFLFVSYFLLCVYYCMCYLPYIFSQHHRKKELSNIKKKKKKSKLSCVYFNTPFLQNILHLFF